MAEVARRTEAWSEAPPPTADGGLAARRAEVAEMVRELREAKAAEAAAQAVRAPESDSGKVSKGMNKEQQMEVMFADMKKGNADKAPAFSRNGGEKVKGYRKQDNFGATKFIKP